jgi:GT2 family glycosyltransferase
MQLSVIILNYNVRYFLEQCVLSVQKAIQNIDAEIIIVDNNSSDDSCAMMKSRFPNVKLVENKKNSGFPKGNNIGVDIAKGKYICILNPDTVVAEDTFIKILAFAKRQENLGIVGCKLIDGTGNFLPESKRGVPTPWVAFTKIFGLYKFFPKSKFFNKYYAQHLLENQTGKVDILVGAFMVMERELYQEIGGFDEKCFMYSDDIDLSYMVLQKGKSNYYFHETSVIHYKGESTVKDGTYMKRFQEAMNFFYKKHFSSDGSESVFFSIFMKIGIVFFSLIKKFQGKQKHKVEPENYILISSPDALGENLRQKLENLLQKTVKIQNVTQSFSENKKTEIIFDNNYLDFRTIIKAFETNKSQNITFKILSESSDYLIGSNSSLDRGEVVILD